jgi:hypothetical protein
MQLLVLMGDSKRKKEARVVRASELNNKFFRDERESATELRRSDDCPRANGGNR